MEEKDWEDEIKIANQVFQKLRKKDLGSGSGLRGTPLYIAFMHSSDGPKILEINSRPGDPEIITILPTLKYDLVDVCFNMIDGNLQQSMSSLFEKKASVLTYAVPLTYGGYRTKFTGKNIINLDAVYKLKEKFGDTIRIYPGAIEIRDRKVYSLQSRALGILGIGDSIQEAREISLSGMQSIDGPLWNRWDIASEGHIQSSINHMKNLRCR
jgi:phosphoribosylamine--glycine ligase